jgi:uncharacterized membrane protein (DUF2068 family)
VLRRRHQIIETITPTRYLPRFHWELLVCGVRGHRVIGADVAKLGPQDAVVAFDDPHGKRWLRCLRCDSWLPIEAPQAPARPRMPPRDEIVLPLRGKALRDRIVLRLIAIDRALHVLVLGTLSLAVFFFAADRAHLVHLYAKGLVAFDGLDPSAPPSQLYHHHGVLHQVDRLFTASHEALILIGIALALYALLEGAEGIGLWFGMRWAEYLTFVANCLFLPYEISELIDKLTVLRALTLVVNIAIVLYLVWGKRLFGLNGGVAAEHREREAEMGWPALERTAPRLPAGATAGPAGR